MKTYNYGKNDKNEYQILFNYNNIALNINIKDKIEKRKDKINFQTVKINFENCFNDYISNFDDLINQIINKSITINLEEKYVELPKKKFLKSLNLQLIKNDKKELKIFFSKNIYTLNVKYYLIKDLENKRINSNPFSSCLKKNYFNKDDILELIENDNILNCYNISELRYYNEEKDSFQLIKNENIPTKENNIFEFQIKGFKNPLITNLKWMNKFINEEIIKIKNFFNRFIKKIQKYDLIYLFASPIIENELYVEFYSEISYMNEIKVIFELFKNSGKKYNYKFKCADENVLRDNIINNKTKILHISSHGEYDGNYSLILENLKKNGQKMELDINKIKLILDINKKNISNLDLVFVSTCYSQDLAELFLEYGAKNVIYIHRKTKIADEAIIKFTKYFYQKLIEGYSIKRAYDYSIDKMKFDKEILNINSKSCCCQHYHKSNCILENNKNYYHNKIHRYKSQKCKCNLIKPNYHNDKCEYYKDLQNIYINKMDKNMNKICCCDLDIEHNEIFKILYKSKNNDCSNISPFKFNSLGKLLINPNIKLYYKENLFLSALGRKGIMARIFNNICNKGIFSILFGEKGLEKINFALALCIYLSQRKIINNYEIFRLYSEIDYLFMINEVNGIIGGDKSKKYTKKDIIIIKFYNNENKFIKIYQEFCREKFIDKLYFIFIFTIKDYDEKTDINKEKNELFKKYIENFIENKEEINFLENSYYVGISEKDSVLLLNHLTKDINLNDKESEDLLKIANNKPKNIKLINILLHQGKSVDEIIKMEKLFIPKIKLIKNKSSYPLYYILTIMPSGLPDCFLKLIFDDYNYIIDDKNLIIKHPDNNWNLVNINKILDENWKESEYINISYKYIFKSLKIYTQLLNYFIEKNKDKINNKYGNIHYIYNSYSNNDIWKCNIINKIEKLLGKNILNKDFDIQKHKQNIINLISLIINKIEIFRQIYHIEVDYFIENILLLFPSFFF